MKKVMLNFVQRSHLISGACSLLKERCQCRRKHFWLACDESHPHYTKEVLIALCGYIPKQSWTPHVTPSAENRRQCQRYSKSELLRVRYH